MRASAPEAERTVASLEAEKSYQESRNAALLLEKPPAVPPHPGFQGLHRRLHPHPPRRRQRHERRRRRGGARAMPRSCRGGRGRGVPPPGWKVIQHRRAKTRRQARRGEAILLRSRLWTGFHPDAGVRGALAAHHEYSRRVQRVRLRVRPNRLGKDVHHGRMHRRRRGGRLRRRCQRAATRRTLRDGRGARRGGRDDVRHQRRNARDLQRTGARPVESGGEGVVVEGGQQRGSTRERARREGRGRGEGSREVWEPPAIRRGGGGRRADGDASRRETPRTSSISWRRAPRVAPPPEPR